MRAFVPALPVPSLRPPRRGHTVRCSAAPPARTAARRALDALVARGGRAGAGVQGEVEDAVMRLVAEGGEVDGSGDWRRDLVGRWELRLSTETPLVKILSAGGDSFLGVGEVYQVVREGGTLQNVVQFKKGGGVLELVVDSDYVFTEGAEADGTPRRAVEFVFRRTMFRLPALFGRPLPTVTIPFAVGRGEFRCVWLDQLRVDICDVPSGQRWINVYSYAGPVEKCPR